MQYLLKLRKWVKVSMLRPVAGAVCLALSLCCGAISVGCLYPLSYSVGSLVFYAAAERVYEAPAAPDATLNGSLVKLRGGELRSECELADTETGVTQKAIALRRAAARKQESAPDRYGIAATDIQMGAYRLVNTPISKIWPFHGPAPRGAVKLKSVPGGQHVLCLPSPAAQSDWYVIGRQQGDALHMEDPAARFATAAEWEACTRAFDEAVPPVEMMLGRVLLLVCTLFAFLWGTVAFWRSAWSCLADVKEYSRIPAWLTAGFCAPSFALLGGAGCLLHYYHVGETVYQYVSRNTLIVQALVGLALLVVWYRLRRWYKFRLMF